MKLKKIVLKFLGNPLFYLLKICRNILSLLLFPINYLLFKKVGIMSYISLRASIRNHKAISIGNYVQINPFVTLWVSNLVIGAHSQINPGTAIYGRVSIGKNTMIAPNCMLAGGNHNFQKTSIPMILQNSNSKGIKIENDVWIGANSTITDGVKIGEGSIIGAHSLVTKDIPPYSIAFGSPAKIIRNRKTK